MGFGLRMTQEKLLKEKTALYQKDKIEFKQTEIEWMTKGKNNYPFYQIGMAIIIVLSLLIVRNPFWQGIGFSVIVFMVGNMIIEAYSNNSLLAYYESLKN